MPQVFSPGEPETRPLDPDAIVYTTPQKVADLLACYLVLCTGISSESKVRNHIKYISSTIFSLSSDYVLEYPC